jgi:hypothetical protein
VDRDLPIGGHLAIEDLVAPGELTTMPRARRSRSSSRDLLEPHRRLLQVRPLEHHRRYARVGRLDRDPPGLRLRPERGCDRAQQRCLIGVLQIATDSLRVVTSGPAPPNPADLLSSDAMASLLTLLHSTADYEVVDTTPVRVVSDAMIVAPRVDGVVVAVEANATTDGAASHSVDQLQQVGGT